MPFPNIDRVIYRSTPLDNVICQLRFPPILSIDAEAPAKFQDKIRSKFPIYDESIEYQSEFSQPMINPIAPGGIINPVGNVTSTKNHAFISADEKWKINLTRTFITISTQKYKKWEEFISNFEGPIKALQEVYSPPFYTRIGLRYLDLFKRSKLGLEDESWEELIKPQFLGMLASDVKDHITEYNNVCVLTLADGISKGRIGTELVRSMEDQEICLLIDSDLFNPTRTAISEASRTLEFLHERSTRLLRFLITEKLHSKMEPMDYE